jgi:hypothetical protein
MGADGKSLKTTPLKVEISRPKIPRKRGRPRKEPTSEERSQRKRQQDTEAQRRHSGLRYQERFREMYREGERKLGAKRKATPQALCTLKDLIVNTETTPHTGAVKRKALGDFDRWVEDKLKPMEDGSQQQTMRK